jgi:MFS family permease
MTAPPVPFTGNVRAAVRRNTALLAASMACLMGMLQVSAAVATVTFVLITGVDDLLGAAPAMVLLASACAAFPAGRAMDRFGRIPVLASGFAIGAAGAAVVAFAARAEAAVPAIAGFALVGAAQGIGNLARTAAGDMYPPDRRARGIALVIFGSVFGAILGPAVFMPLFAGKDLEADALFVPWLVAAGFMVVGMAIVLQVRPDPKSIGERLGYTRGPAGQPAAPLAEILRRPGALPALLAATASFAVMVAVMNLTGHVLIRHGHHQHAVFPVISAHLLGMFGLVLFVGDLVDRLGRPASMAGGLTTMALSCVCLAWIESVPATAVALFGLGIGWAFSFVAATAQMADLAAPAERGRLLGFSDGVSGISGAVLALGGGYALSAAGVAALAAGATALAAGPVLALLAYGRMARPAHVLQE